MKKTLINTNIKDAKKNVSDIQVFSNGDLFQLVLKASSRSEGWMKSTKAMNLPTGCVIQVSTQQENPDGSYVLAEAITFVENINYNSSDSNFYKI